MKMYKQFRQDKDGTLHPLYVDARETIPVGIWMKAKDPGMTMDGKVLSKLGKLAYRPGWHLSEAPFAPHIGIKIGGRIKFMHDTTVWALCEVHDEIDYTPEAHTNGISRSGKYIARNACLKRLPEGGFYWYNTNPNAFGNWVIADMIKVERVLTDAEVEEICMRDFGIHALPHRKEVVA